MDPATCLYQRRHYFTPDVRKERRAVNQHDRDAITMNTKSDSIAFDDYVFVYKFCHVFHSNKIRNKIWPNFRHDANDN